MNIRILEESDAVEFSRLRLEALEEDPLAFGSSPEEHRALSLEEIRHRIRPKLGEEFVVGAIAEGALIGNAGFYRHAGVKRRHKGHIWGVYVISAYRGRGIARQLMHALLDHAAGIEGLEQIDLCVTTTQSGAAALYRSLGFEVYGREPRALKVGDRYFGQEHMLLRLKSRLTPTEK